MGLRSLPGMALVCRLGIIYGLHYSRQFVSLRKDKWPHPGSRAINLVCGAREQQHLLVIEVRQENQQAIGMFLADFSTDWQGTKDVAQCADAANNDNFFTVAQPLKNQPEREKN